MNAPQIFTYFDNNYFTFEQKHLFNEAPQYMGHELMCPNNHDYNSIAWLNHNKLIYNDGGKHLLISNICRHRQAIMMKGQGNSHNIVCGLHKWTYTPHGKLIGAPLFSEPPRCKNLESEELQNWKGLLFRNNRNIAHDLKYLGHFSDYIDFSNYQYSNTQISEYDFNWKTFIEVYAEDYHVEPFHPGLGNFVDCSSLQWSFGNWHHFQVVPIKGHLTNKSGSKLYDDWQRKVIEAHEGQLPKFGAIWMTYYPNIMIECYPKAIVISVVEPLSAQKCRVITEFYYPDEILGFDSEYVELQQRVYLETAKEDDEICYRMHEGRKALYRAGINDSGPYQQPTEAGLEHFHQFLIRETKSANSGDELFQKVANVD